MKRKIIDLDTFFNKKNTFEKKVFRQLKRFNTKEEKKTYLDEANIEKVDLHITDDDYNALRKKKISNAGYIQSLNDEITVKYNEFNQYKLDVLYDFELMDQTKYDALETEINSLKKTRDEFIIKQKKVLEDETKKIDGIKLQIKERVDEFSESSKEEQKELYSQIITLKKDVFEFLKPKLSMVTIIPNTQIFDDMANVEFITLVTDYLPIHNNEQILNKEVGSEVELTPEELE
jgi:gas vesicle protein